MSSAGESSTSTSTYKNGHGKQPSWAPPVAFISHCKKNSAQQDTRQRRSRRQKNPSIQKAAVWPRTVRLGTFREDWPGAGYLTLACMLNRQLMAATGKLDLLKMQIQDSKVCFNTALPSQSVFVLTHCNTCSACSVPSPSYRRKSQAAS
jgi:hypothetical protein